MEGVCGDGGLRDEEPGDRALRSARPLSECTPFSGECWALYTNTGVRGREELCGEDDALPACCAMYESEGSNARGAAEYESSSWTCVSWLDMFVGVCGADADTCVKARSAPAGGLTLDNGLVMRCAAPRCNGGDALLDTLEPRGGDTDPCEWWLRKDLLAETGGVGARGGDELWVILMLVLGGGVVVRGGEEGALDGAGAALFTRPSCVSCCA